MPLKGGSRAQTSGAVSKNLDIWLKTLYDCIHLHEQNVLQLIFQARNIFVDEPNIIEITSPVTVVGDLHGQFFDLMELFSLAGRCPGTSYLVMGDFVDRGAFSVETATLLICLKVRYPNRITILRGNHESREVSHVYGFYDEIMRKYSNAQVWNEFMNLFDYMPFSAVIDNRIFCCHGGLGPSVDVLDHVRKIQRVQEVPHEGPLCDFLWSDPTDDSLGFGVNPRGAGYLWGKDVTKEWCRSNKLTLICRAHQLVMNGFNFNHNKRTVTLFSAPNYCYRCGNLGGFMKVGDKGEPVYHTFKEATRTHAADQTFMGKRHQSHYFL